MSQHINLLSKKRTQRGAVWLAVRGMGLVFVVLGVFGMAKEYAIYQLHESELQAQASIDTLSQDLSQLRRVLGLEEQQAIAKQASAMRSEIEARRDWMDWIQKGDLGTIFGYSGILQTLSTIHEDGVWLQAVEMPNNNALIITGHAMNNETLMRYANQVTQTLKPLDYAFTSLEIAKENPLGDGKFDSTILKFKLY